jgi:hypothetical protein
MVYCRAAKRRARLAAEIAFRKLTRQLAGK